MFFWNPYKITIIKDAIVSISPKSQVQVHWHTFKLVVWMKDVPGPEKSFPQAREIRVEVEIPCHLPGACV